MLALYNFKFVENTELPRGRGVQYAAITMLILCQVWMTRETKQYVSPKHLYVDMHADSLVD